MKRKNVQIILLVVLLAAVAIVTAFFLVKLLSVDNTAVETSVTAVTTTTDDTQSVNKPDGLEQIKVKIADDFKNKYGNIPKLSFYIKDLTTGESVVCNDVQMNSASVIKLFIAQAAYETDKQNMSDETKANINRMITESHNESSNNLIDKYSFMGINRIISKHGYNNTELRRKMYNTTPPGGPSGEDNLTSVTEVGILLESIWNETFVNAECSKEILDLLGKQQRTNKIPRIIKDYKNVKVYNKTGELTSVENDVAIISGIGDSGKEYNFIFCMFVNDIPNNDANSTYKEDIQKFIADAAVELVNYFKAL